MYVCMHVNVCAHMYTCAASLQFNLFNLICLSFTCLFSKEKERAWYRVWGRSRRYRTNEEHDEDMVYEVIFSNKKRVQTEHDGDVMKN